ncbi:hypothetical protein GS545_25405 [Rhodococcus hoagii]|nr:hypothetical protein [Prescottella equi]
MTRTVIDKVIELIVVLFVVSLGTFALVSLIRVIRPSRCSVRDVRRRSTHRLVRTWG